MDQFSQRFSVATWATTTWGFGRTKDVRLYLWGYTQSVGSDEAAGRDFRS